ncbi:GTP cyclohydrolase II [Methylobacterium sp. 4-46]|uniref:GTP cyclohydrolase II RibA n=1 Tax=unclassified Methylobacterium TaxID=2615210 RepID=UPI000152C9A7|nr:MULTISPECIES: GTP cyclohydrolase II RibA [Methylobacterium]ACA16818.1 GTP cyclohydrolase II [Methylobacterium sp. 4-46]WFT82512.1 GTP cyclohydrolase II RibA [Methylobacterium nodulans]
MSMTVTIVEERLGREQVQVERAVAEMRAGRPVAIAGETCAVAVSAEAVSPELADALQRFGTGAHLVLPAPRLRRIGLANRFEAGCVAMPEIDPERIVSLALRVDGRIDAPVCCPARADAVALELARLAQVIPAVLVVPVPAPPGDLVAVEPGAVEAFRTRQAAALQIVSRAPVPLDGAPETEFVVFRGGEGLRDQVAVVIGRPDPAQPVAVRVHSACLTGDLFGSLKCDCGDQLRGTAKWMAQNGGGIILYLDQEGRGNGLANKIRAYALQAKGYDTYAADEMLGFGLDQRRFDFAAAMLRCLGVASVRVLSNNPEKVAALAAAGLAVVGEQRALGRVTPENARYLAAKRDVAGHALDLGAFACAEVSGS